MSIAYANRFYAIVDNSFIPAESNTSIPTKKTRNEKT